MTEYTQHSRVCSDCLLSKPESDYHKQSNRKDGLRPYCKACGTIRSREWCEKNLERYRERQHRYSRENKDRLLEKQRQYRRECREKAFTTNKNWRLRKDYGITKRDYDSMLVGQRGRCAVCQELPTESNYLVVDHNHSTGAVRAILCKKCNCALGMFQDEPDNLLNAIAYLGGSNLDD